MQPRALLANELLLAVTLSPSSAVTQLSIARKNDISRAVGMSFISQIIKNEYREIMVGNVSYPDFDGPVLDFNQSSAGDDSLYASMLPCQSALLLFAQSPKLREIRDTMEELVPFDSHNVTAFHMAYFALEKKNLTSSSSKALLISDESFDTRRLGTMSHNLQLVPVRIPSLDLWQLTDELVQDDCGEANITTAVTNKCVYVANFSTVGEFTDEARNATKYTPSIGGFFCFNNARSTFLPLAIEYSESKLMLTKNDTHEDWTLAKMALDVAELNHQMMQHQVQVHKLMIPIQVEMIRAIDPKHPVYALLEYHFGPNFAIENRSQATLFYKNSSFDQTFGFGISGALRFAKMEQNYARADEDFRDEMERRGLTNLPSHRLIASGVDFYRAFREFVRSYLKAFYASENEIQNDPELQNWAQQAAKLKFLRGFPDKFTGFEDLTKLLTHLVFQNTVRHQMMHGPSTWDNIGAPFVTPAHWSKRLALERGSGVDPLDYAMPSELLPTLFEFAAGAACPVQAQLSLLHVYNVMPFVNESRLAAPIARFHQAMQSLEEREDADESSELINSYVRPSQVPIFPFA